MGGLVTEQVHIDSLSYGRAGVARLEGRVLFVEGAAPGDRVRVEVTRDHGSWAEARVVDLIEAGADRVRPPCPVAGSCGGCPWQHVSYPAQLEGKHRAVTDSLERIAGIEHPPVEQPLASSHTLGYRNRLKLRFEDGRLGFYQASSHRLVALDDCPIAEDRVRAAMAPVTELVASLMSRVTRVEIASRGELSGVVVAVNSAGRLRPADREQIKSFLAQPRNPVRGVLMWGRGWSRRWGDTRRRFILDGEGTTTEASGTAFGQINSDGNRQLISLVIEMLAPRPRDTVLDLYAGAGNFTLPLARRARQVIAVEADLDAVTAGRESAAYQKLDTVRFVRDRVEHFVGHPPIEADGIVVNPPRNGLGRAAASIASLRTPRIVYVSCDPATLARDLLVFAEHGYTLDRAVPVDMFPHTFHVETVCGLTCS